MYKARNSRFFEIDDSSSSVFAKVKIRFASIRKGGQGAALPLWSNITIENLSINSVTHAASTLTRIAVFVFALNAYFVRPRTASAPKGNEPKVSSLVYAQNSVRKCY